MTKLSATGRAVFAKYPNSERCMHEHEALLDGVKWSIEHAHRHGLSIGAYSLIPFIAPSGDFEYVWNARNAIPRIKLHLSASGELAEAIKLPIFAPLWTPRVGDQVMVSFTELRAKIVARERIEKMRLDGGREWDEFMAVCKRNALSYEDAVKVNVEHILSSDFSDVIHVTAGWVEGLETARRDGNFFSVHELAAFPAFIEHVVSVGALTPEEGERVLQTVIEHSAKEGTDIVLYEPRQVEDVPIPEALDMVLRELQGNEDVHLAVRVALAIRLHARMQKIDFRIDQAVTNSPAKLGVKVLRMSSFWNAEVFICTTREGEKRIGTQVMIVGPTWPREHEWKGCAVHASIMDAIVYHESLCQMLGYLFDVKPDPDTSVEDVIKLSRQKAGQL